MEKVEKKGRKFVKFMVRDGERGFWLDIKFCVFSCLVVIVVLWFWFCFYFIFIVISFLCVDISCGNFVI